eukprot:NODE_547_length_1821_cov_39.652893_g539_i0.p2 GENE.NODE_547_length_1821_cov_39.652893_g539_i0~~NODE_547_length_1821_cov_39.652893_g539_i0.p2  ORF type:complete len:171 (+),score=40.53 NODE_547_length_1821_cov_39.652893_g539_i0:957-1469(+)
MMRAPAIAMEEDGPDGPPDAPPPPGDDMDEDRPPPGDGGDDDDDASDMDEDLDDVVDVFAMVEDVLARNGCRLHYTRACKTHSVYSSGQPLCVANPWALQKWLRDLSVPRAQLDELEQLFGCPKLHHEALQPCTMGVVGEGLQRLVASPLRTLTAVLPELFIPDQPPFGV